MKSSPSGRFEDPWKKESSSNNFDHLVDKNLPPVEDLEDFHNPFSSLSLFLVKSIRKEVHNNAPSWSKDVEEKIVERMLPEFKEKFPNCKLSKFTLRKTWERISYFMRNISNETLNCGQLNLQSMIKNGLKNLLQKGIDLSYSKDLAHNLALKIGTCSASLDGEKVNIENLTTSILAIQQHLMPGNKKVPSHVCDEQDKIIISILLRENAKQPNLSFKDLLKVVMKKIRETSSFIKNSSTEKMQVILKLLLAEKLYPYLKLPTPPLETKKLIKDEISTIKTEKDPCKAILQAIERIVYLYNISSKLSVEDIRKNLDVALQYIYSISSSEWSVKGDILHEDIYTFIVSEIALLKKKHSIKPLSEMLSILMASFEKIKHLPKMDGSTYDDLQILMWYLSKKENPIKGIPHVIREFALNELANVHIKNRNTSFEEICKGAHRAMLKIAKADNEDLERKTKIWCSQHDMICSRLFFNEDDEIFNLICKERRENPLWAKPSKDVMKRLLPKIVKSLSLEFWKKQISQRALITYKYLWYTECRDESAFERFIKWHINESPDDVDMKDIGESIKNMVPMFPFTNDYLEKLMH